MSSRACAAAVLAACLLAPAEGRAQFGGNAAFAQGGGRARAEQNERAKRVLADNDLPTSGTSTYLDASVLANVKADEYVAVFAVAREGATAEECGRAMDAAVRALTDAFKTLGVKDADLFVDFVAQARVYGFQMAGDVAREKAAGLELKKNVIVHFADKALLDRLVAAAARAEVFDLVKVDYVVKDPKKVQEQLAQEAARVLREKARRYEALLGLKLKPAAQVVAERSAAYSPPALYDAYTAAESEQVDVPDRGRVTTHSARKTRTFYYNGLDPSSFDAVIDPVVVEPVVQFTFYIKVRHDAEAPPAK